MRVEGGIPVMESGPSEDNGKTRLALPVRTEREGCSWQTRASPHLESDQAGILFGDIENCGNGKGTPLQSSRLENPRDGGAWWAAVHGVAQSQT